ncbi:MAG: flippase-like domain-containing protein, partial [Candidatus Binatia bacterium]
AFCSLLFIVVGFWLGGERFFNATLGRLLPTGARAWCLHVLSSARDGLQILPNKRLVGIVFLVTLGMWSLPIVSSYVLMLAFDLQLPFAAALVVFVAIGLGTALPAPPGMVGVFQIASVVALGLFGVPKAEALAYGILLNAVQFFTLVAQGLVALPMLGSGVGRVTRAALAEA